MSGVKKVPAEGNGRWSRKVMNWLKLCYHTTGSGLSELKVLGSVPGCGVLHTHCSRVACLNETAVQGFSGDLT